MELRVKEFFALIFLLVAGVFGLFMSLDLFFIFVWFDVSLFPMYLLIAIWGSTRKEYGAMKLTLYLLAGSALILPAIVNLDITAPETSGSGRTNSYVRSAGEMTLYLELYDSVTGDIIAKAVDRQVDRENNQMYTWANSSTNKAAADRILNGWADILIAALNDAKVPSPAPATIED